MYEYILANNSLKRFEARLIYFLTDYLEFSFFWVFNIKNKLKSVYLGRKPRLFNLQIFKSNHIYYEHYDSVIFLQCQYKFKHIVWLLKLVEQV